MTTTPALATFTNPAATASVTKTESLAQRRRREQSEAKLSQAQQELTLPNTPALMLKGIPAHLWQTRTGKLKDGSTFTYRVFDSDTVYKTPRRPLNYKQTEDPKQNEVVL